MKDDTIDSIIFSGGTGLSQKDITYETLEPRLEKKFSGFGELFRFLSYNEIGASSMLSRATAGILRSKKKKSYFLTSRFSRCCEISFKVYNNPRIRAYFIHNQ